MSKAKPTADADVSTLDLDDVPSMRTEGIRALQARFEAREKDVEVDFVTHRDTGTRVYLNADDLVTTVDIRRALKKTEIEKAEFRAHSRGHVAVILGYGNGFDV